MNIEYMYAVLEKKSDNAVIILRVEDIDNVIADTCSQRNAVFNILKRVPVVLAKNRTQVISPGPENIIKTA